MRMALAIFAAGLALASVGVVYGVMFAGIPYQDPTPDQLAGCNRHSRVADWIMLAGLLTSAAGFLATCVMGGVAAIRRLTSADASGILPQDQGPRP
jgi:hypothetical protein